MKRYVKPQKNSRKTLTFILVAAFLMIAVDAFMWEWQKRSFLEETRRIGQKEHYDDLVLMGSEIKDFVSAKTIIDKMAPAENLNDQVFMHVTPPEAIEEDVDKILVKPVKKQAWKDNAVITAVPKKKAKIIIIIDDMGMDRKRSYQALDLPGPITFAFLPYAPDLKTITADARRKGHELLIHVPMEPLNKNLNPGPLALLEHMSKNEIEETLEHIFGTFKGYVGINNHMGSRLTQNKNLMHVVMKSLAERGLIFVDSKTIHTSVAAEVAAMHGLDYAERHVFLDHHDTPEFVHKSLDRLESIARKNGYAIAIGHPKDSTISALKEWLPTLKKKGLSLVPVSAAVKKGKPQSLASKVSSVPVR